MTHLPLTVVKLNVFAWHEPLVNAAQVSLADEKDQLIKLIFCFPSFALLRTLIHFSAFGRSILPSPFDILHYCT
jgi:hypothetical protein